ncbi:hypothetical protein RND71_041527 [Anisodus tanguticus]|uniref:Terpene synthase N-terminal domain-containing protein n=1 Tax=Anisodus tanguticus TaxID=243964 RepID=A0AAE1QUX3_9SOLA|nr:hypothetical protein RND71_041527 [Anisodus tanguticus]
MFLVFLDILNDFKDEQGNFNQSLCKDIEGLQLYEASYLSTETENDILESANTFTMSHLKKHLPNNQQGEDNLTFSLVRHALELPLHCMMLRVETKWYINIYERMPNADPQMLEFELAKLDYNIVQAIHQEDLRNLSSFSYLFLSTVSSLSFEVHFSDFVALKDEKFIRRRDELKMEVMIMLNDHNTKPLNKLEIIDNLQRLGLCYHFEDEIYNILNKLCGKFCKRSKRDLYAKALEFRLLRQHGFNISQGAL